VVQAPPRWHARQGEAAGWACQDVALRARGHTFRLESGQVLKSFFFFLLCAYTADTSCLLDTFFMHSSAQSHISQAPMLLIAPHGQ